MKITSTRELVKDKIYRMSFGTESYLFKYPGNEVLLDSEQLHWGRDSSDGVYEEDNTTCNWDLDDFFNIDTGDALDDGTGIYEATLEEQAIYNGEAPTIHHYSIC